MKHRHILALTVGLAFSGTACSTNEGNSASSPSGGGGESTSTGGSGASGDGGNGSGGDTGMGGGSGGGDAALPDTCIFPADATLENAELPDGYCASTWATDLERPRGIIVDENGNALVVDDGRIVLLHDDDEDGFSGADERMELVTQTGLNHGIALSGGYLYASTESTVFRWAYSGDRQQLGSPQEVVTGIPSGGHSTRTLQFDSEGRLYVSVGSAGNVDDDSSRSRLIRYAADDLESTSTFEEGELFADGLRNEVGIAMDDKGRIWGVENGRDNLERDDLGGDIHNDNPGEELNLFREEDAGEFYGYPYCWSEGSLAAGSGPGTQWADPDNTTHDDAWCRNPDNVIPPVMVMQAHSAPLDIEFYQGPAFPSDVRGDAIITFHGSWNRSPETGYKVVRVPFDADGMPSGDPVSLLESENPGDRDPDWPHRPVGLAILPSGILLVTSDASGVIIAIGHEGN